MSQEYIAIFMFASMMLMLFTGQRVFGAIGAVGAVAALLLAGEALDRHGFAQSSADEILRNAADEFCGRCRRIFAQRWRPRNRYYPG